MKSDSLYMIAEGRCYIRVEPDKLGREKTNLRLAIGLARDKIQTLRAKLAGLDEQSEAYDSVQEEINDYEMLISDAEDRFEDLLNIPPLA